jgi:hypothetical protein
VAAADGGSNGATLAMAYRYLYGLGGVEPDCEQALKLYQVRVCGRCGRGGVGREKQMGEPLGTHTTPLAFSPRLTR